MIEKKHYLTILLVSFLVFCFFKDQDLLAESKGLTFSTWEGFEVDKCASIWFIKRFVDKNAIIKFFPKGTPITEGIPFDTPDAKFRRYHNMSTYESLLNHYNLKDARLIYIGKIIHDAEVNKWEHKVYPETIMLQKRIMDIVKKSKNNEDVIEKSLVFFDLIYREAKK